VREQTGMYGTLRALVLMIEYSDILFGIRIREDFLAGIAFSINGRSVEWERRRYADHGF
jgi:hypothetical protein